MDASGDEAEDMQPHLVPVPDDSDDADGEDGKCSKRASSSKAAKYLWDQLDESEQQEYYQKSLAIKLKII